MDALKNLANKGKEALNKNQGSQPQGGDAPQQNQPQGGDAPPQQKNDFVDSCTSQLDYVHVWLEL